MSTAVITGVFFARVTSGIVTEHFGWLPRFCRKFSDRLRTGSPWT